MSRSFADNINSFNVSNVSNHYTVADDRYDILAWLSPLEPRIRHQDIRTHRADNVGEWRLQTDEFQRWCDCAEQDGSGYATLFCCGGPAVGKTYFSSLVVDKLCDKAKDKNIAVACFYVDFATRKEQSPKHMLGSILKQIVGGLERIPDEISQTFEDYKRVIGGRGLRVPDIVKMLQTVTSLQPTYICVDALDEFVEGHRPEVLDSLRQVLERSPNTRIFLTGRQHIHSEIDRYLGGRAAVLSIKPNNGDIVGYIRMRLSKDISQGAMDSGLEAEIIKSITENIPETFLLISLTIDAIPGEITAYGRRQKLRAVTGGLDLKDVYGATLERIKEQGGEKTRLGMAALMWISHSERLLQLDELLHALAVEIGSIDINAERIHSVETLLSSCLGLVVVDGETLAVRLIHFTLQEYLSTCPNLFGATHSIMAETCLTYLNFQTILDLSPPLLALPQPTPFLEYSSLYWGVHAKRETSRDVVSLALRLFRQSESHISFELLLEDLISRTSRFSSGIPIDCRLVGFTGLHCASVFGIVEIVTALMDQPNCDLNKSDCLGVTPLIWAAICGQGEVAKLLLEQQIVIPDKPDERFHRTALSWAAGKGHEGIVGLLLDRASAKSDGTDGWWGKTPRVMNMALGRRYVNPNRPDKCGQTPIFFAAEEGHEGAVELLLGRKDVKPDMVDKDGQTPLSLACEKGRVRVVKLLLERQDVNPERHDKYALTPLLLASQGGHDGAVRLLLGRKDIDPTTPGRAGQNPLWLASRGGHEEVVKLLLEREDINPNTPNHAGQTPLLLASKKGHEGVVELLLGRKDTNPNTPDATGQTPLLLASREGHDGTVRLLFGREEINLNMPNHAGQTPLLLASKHGHAGVAKLLLGGKDVEPNTPDKAGHTPLLLASKQGHEGVVKLLVGRKDVDPNKPDKAGQTPLSLACEMGYEGVVGLLLEREDANPNPLDMSGLTPLLCASGRGGEGVVKLLLGRKDINPNTPSSNGQTPLSLACEKGHEGVVKLLLGSKYIHPDMPDNDGQTPLSLASQEGHKGVVKLLLEWEDIRSERLGAYTWTSVSLAFSGDMREWRSYS